ncbi:MAG: ATP synthase subunit C [Treponemataceae bacterium]
MKRKSIIVLLMICFACVGLFASDEVASAESQNSSASAAKYIAAAVAVGLACIAGGMAVGKIGAAAMGAMAENAELSGKALPFVGLAEGICLWGFLVAVLLIFS